MLEEQNLRIKTNPLTRIHLTLWKRHYIVLVVPLVLPGISGIVITVEHLSTACTRPHLWAIPVLSVGSWWKLTPFFYPTRERQCCLDLPQYTPNPVSPVSWHNLPGFSLMSKPNDLAFVLFQEVKLSNSITGLFFFKPKYQDHILLLSQNKF